MAILEECHMYETSKRLFQLSYLDTLIIHTDDVTLCIPSVVVIYALLTADIMTFPNKLSEIQQSLLK